MPLVRRLDLEYPQHKEARDASQWLLGDDLLVLPFLDIDKQAVPVPVELMKTADGKPGVGAEYFTAADYKGGKPSLARAEPKCGFKFEKGWPDGLAAPGAPATDWFAVRYAFRLGPIPAPWSYVIGLTGRGGGTTKMRFDGEAVADLDQDEVDMSWKFDAKGANPKERPRKMILAPGKTYEVVVEHKTRAGVAGKNLDADLVWRPLIPLDHRSGWIPPGHWEDLWSGEVVEGPRTIELAVPGWKVPLFVRRGGMILLGPDMPWTQEKPWDPITIEAFPPLQDGETTRELYEDDGLSRGYLANEFLRTPILLKRQGGRISVGIGAAAGAYKGQLDKRGWVVRLRLRPGENLKAVSADGKPVEAKTIAPRAARELAPTAYKDIPLPLTGAGAAPPPQAGPVVEVHLPAADIRQAREAVLELAP
jgi:hypothetical protein